ncbi:outer membrane protein [Acetobacter pasteurianus NBRC 3299]|nr:hypothetical protein BBA71_09060 [Acetobacter pasteurianus]GCD74143.1 outer membrane protein [Acetobacter pasteurianus NBRC 3299]
MTTTQWTGNSGDALWDTSGNWSAGTPDKNSDVVFDNTNATGPVTVNLATGTYPTINSLSLTPIGGFYPTIIDGNSTSTDTTYLSINGPVTVADGYQIEFVGAVNTTITGTLTGDIYIDQSSTVVLYGDASAGNVSFGTTAGAQHNTLQIYDPDAIPASISTLSVDDTIVFSFDVGTGQPTWSQNSDGSYNLTGSNGVTMLQNVSFYPGSDPSQMVWDSAQGILNCFLAGSMILTSSGLQKVEDIRIGDEIIAYVDGKEISRPVIWAGKKRASVRADLPDDEAGYPVRIAKDAIAENVPYKDMLVTAEHCLFFDGKFVPARMLVNGRSISYDKSITSYDYYHIETESHSVIMADGMLTESYLDTGNRSSFKQSGNLVSIAPSRNLTWNDAAAPLDVSRAFAEPLFRQIEARANQAGYAAPTKAPALTNEADIHLVTETGAIIRKVREHNGHVMFMLPPGVKSVRIISNASRPTDVFGPFVDDRRYMGVAVADVRLLCAQHQYDITAHLQAEKPEGWHATDWADCAWTNGDAVLPLGNHLSGDKVGILSLTIRAAGPYLTQTQHMAQMKVHSA